MKISENMIYVGVNDENIDIFEGQYKVPAGITYNSYLIKDKKNVLMDTVDKRKVSDWLKNVEEALKGEPLDYLVVSHLEPDHSDGIKQLLEKYPKTKIISNQKVFAFLPQFFEIEHLEEKEILVKEGDTFPFGEHTLHFIMAPMVHWPEVMMTYEEKEKILFSADAFGTFGVVSEYDEKEQMLSEAEKHSKEELWLDEARRYYVNIVGKYGIQVQNVLKKVETRKIEKICPLHGFILTENLNFYLEKYNTWSSYGWENEGIFIACASMHGYTLEAMQELKELLRKRTSKEVKLFDLTREDITYAVAEAFKYKHLVLASPTYNGELFPTMDSFLRLLKGKSYQNRKVMLVENGTWAPLANKCMRDIINQMKNIEIAETGITIKSKMAKETKTNMEEVVENLQKSWEL